MKKILILTVLILSMVFSVACTSNEIAKNYGGTITIDLPQGEKLEVATWKDANLWYLTRKARAGETPEKHEFHEQSTYGMMQGTVIFQEH